MLGPSKAFTISPDWADRNNPIIVLSATQKNINVNLLNDHVLKGILSKAFSF